MLSTTQISYLYLCLRGSLHLAKFAIPIVVQVLAQVIRKVERSKIHIAQVKKILKVSLESCFQSKDQNRKYADLHKCAITNLPIKIEYFITC